MIVTFDGFVGTCERLRDIFNLVGSEIAVEKYFLGDELIEIELRLSLKGVKAF